MSNIVINDIPRYEQYIANVGDTIFQYNFPIYDESYINVYSTADGNAADDTNQILILNSDYTVTGVGAETGGTIVLSGGATQDDRITIVGKMPIERLTNYVNFAGLNVESLNTDFNRIIVMVQEVNRDTQKIISKYQYTELQDTKNLRLPVLGTDNYWKKTALGIEAVAITESDGWSTLRSELANDQVGTDGSNLVGYYDSGFGSTTVHAAIGQVKVGRYGVDSGAANAYVVTLSPAPTAYSAGERVDVKVTNSNTTTSTINVNTLGLKTIKVFIGNVISDIPANAMPAGIVSQLIYDGTFFQLMNPQEITDFSTGFVALTYDLVAPSGWIDADDGSIGSVASGATTRANADTQALYELWWNNVSSPSANAFCAVAGGLGVSALADFAADKALALPYHKGRVIAGFGAPTGISGYTPVLGEHEGEHEHVTITNEMPTHEHGMHGSGGSLTKCQSGAGDGTPDVSVVTYSAGGGLAHNNVQPTSHTNVIIRL